MLPHLSVAKHGYISEGNLAKVVPYTSLQVENPAVNGRLLLRLHDAVCK